MCGKESIEAVRICRQPAVGSSQFVVSGEVIVSLPDKLRAQQNVFEHTGGLHACALFDLEGNLKLLREDVGRHNALDKLIGASCHAKFIEALPRNKTIEYKYLII